MIDDNSKFDFLPGTNHSTMKEMLYHGNVDSSLVEKWRNSLEDYANSDPQPNDQDFQPMAKKALPLVNKFLETGDNAFLKQAVTLIDQMKENLPQSTKAERYALMEKLLTAEQFDAVKHLWE